MYFLLTYARNDRREGGGMMALPKETMQAVVPCPLDNTASWTIERGRVSGKSADPGFNSPRDEMTTTALRRRRLPKTDSVRPIVSLFKVQGPDEPTLAQMCATTGIRKKTLT